MEETFKPGEYVIYACNGIYQLGKIKRVTANGAFVWYSGGDTAAMTPYYLLKKLQNPYVIKQTNLGGSSVVPEV